jgi:hypothetical protein
MFLGALPGSAGCLKKATETPKSNAGHPIYFKSVVFLNLLVHGVDCDGFPVQSFWDLDGGQSGTSRTWRWNEQL